MEKNIDNIINDLMINELIIANEKFHKFASRHEAHSVLLEEIEEAKEELQMIELQFSYLWKAIRTNDTKDNVRNNLIYLENYCMKCIKEMIQVGAMVKKFGQLERRDDK